MNYSENPNSWAAIDHFLSFQEMVGLGHCNGVVRIPTHEMNEALGMYYRTGTDEYWTNQLKRDWKILLDPSRREYVLTWKGIYRRPPRGNA